MRLKLAWQKGSTDLVSVAVGLTIMSIVTAGTTAAVSYSRDILLRQENYKKAAYFLRGQMEQSVYELWKFGPDMYGSLNLGERDLGSYPLQSQVVTGGTAVPTYVRVHRDRIEAVDLLETTEVPDFFRVTCRATWEERDLSGNVRPEEHMERQIVLSSAVPIKR